jgi:hypothetical protein
LALPLTITLRYLAVDVIVGHEGVQHRREHLQHPDLDELPLASSRALEQRAKRCVRSVRGRPVIADQHLAVQRWPVRVAVQIPHAAHRLNDAIEGYVPVLVAPASIACDMHQNGARIELLQPLEAKAELVGHAGPIVGDDHVCPIQQRIEHLLRVGVAKIKRHRPFAAVVACKEQAVAVLVDRDRIAGMLAAQRLDLDDVGSMIAKDHRRVRASDEVRDFKHVHAVERALRL